MKKFLLLMLTGSALWAAPPPEMMAARLFFSDANISFNFLNHWELGASFPYGPLFNKTTQQGSQAYITCEISPPFKESRALSDVPYDILHSFAKQDLAQRQPQAQILAKSDRWLAGRHAHEVTWKETSDESSLEYQALYFFNQDRIYVLTLRAHADSFLWLVPDFQEWLTTVRILSRRDSGSLDAPAHGGLWIHQTGGAKIAVPEEWLIGVADDRTLGAALARGDKHSEWTATVDLDHRSTEALTDVEKKEARQTIERKGFQVKRAEEKPFHGLPAYKVEYDGTQDGRYVRGVDLWVSSPKARWLFNWESDGSLFIQLADDYETFLNGIEFLDDRITSKS